MAAHPRALAVMVKPPEAGRVKTRLVPPLTPDLAASLYRSFIIDITRETSRLSGVDIFLSYSPGGDLEPLRALASAHGSELVEQQGAGLGERLYNLFKYLFEMGYNDVAIIGSDSPDLSHALIEEAFSELASFPGSLVIGPAVDGGYYLIAMDELRSEPFINIPWSTERVLEKTLEKCPGARLLPRWHDVDNFSDLALIKEGSPAIETLKFIKENKLLERNS